MRHTISYRELSPEEASRVRHASGLGVERWLETYFLLPVMVGGGVVILGIFLAGGAAWHWSKLELGSAGRVALLIIVASGVVGFLAACAAVRDVRRHRRREKMDMKSQRVEVIRVEDARMIEQEEFNDEGPLYYFGIGQGKVLFLGGQWMLDTAVYGLGSQTVASETETDDWPPFPSSSFTAHRLPASGQILHLETSGKRLPVDAVLPRKAALPPWLRSQWRKGELGDSFLVNGDFEELARATHEAPARRLRKRSRPVQQGDGTDERRPG